MKRLPTANNPWGIAFVVLALLSFSSFANAALTATPTGTVVTVSYQEPNTNADNLTPLTDLDHTSIYYQIGTTVTKAMDVPATAATGNGQITRDVTVPIGPNQEANVTFWATATDNAPAPGPNTSAESNRVTVRIDRLPPGAPR